MSQSSSIAFPGSVGVHLLSLDPPRLHSFAYHAGIRAEPECAVPHKPINTVSCWDHNNSPGLWLSRLWIVSAAVRRPLDEAMTRAGI
ncbi:hypothetical protein V1509DRAFT_496971 [Lipomyces kononenkoae]